jgi:hypothetical protein
MATGSRGPEDGRLVQLRCPQPYRPGVPGRLLAILWIGDDAPEAYGRYFEIACVKECLLRYRADGRLVRSVRHRYNLAGDLIETLVEEVSENQGERPAVGSPG